jgi:hypothetical protein
MREGRSASGRSMTLKCIALENANELPLLTC